MFKYSVRKLKEIADNYTEYCPDQCPSDKIWASKYWTDVIDQKVDFDRAYARLDVWQKKLVWDVYTFNIHGRDRIFRQMRNYLNGKQRDDDAYKKIMSMLAGWLPQEFHQRGNGSACKNT